VRPCPGDGHRGIPAARGASLGAGEANGRKFTDIDVAEETRIDLFGKNGGLIFGRDVLPSGGDELFSFLSMSLGHRRDRRCANQALNQSRTRPYHATATSSLAACVSGTAAQAGATHIERVDEVIRCVAQQLGKCFDQLHEITSIVEDRLRRNRRDAETVMEAIPPAVARAPL
jgi:hypothetical protein